MEYAGVKTLELRKRRTGGKKVGICLMMKLLVGASASWMNFLDSMRRQKGRKDGPLLVGYTFALQHEMAYLQISKKELGARDWELIHHPYDKPSMVNDTSDPEPVRTDVHVIEHQIEGVDGGVDWDGESTPTQSQR
jgi:hypothetical protein